MNKNLIRVFEHQVLRIGESGFNTEHFNTLVKYNDSNENKYFIVGNNKIKFKNYVGVIQVKKLTIEILPKADNLPNDESNKNKWQKALLIMLKECKLIKIESISRAFLNIKNNSLIDLYFDAFLTEAEKIFNQGLIKKYGKERTNTNVIKGKILFEKNIKNIVHKEKSFCEYQIYTKDNIFNQIIYKALLILSKSTTNNNLLMRAKNLSLCFKDINNINVNKNSFDNIKFNRNNERYRYSIELSKLIILNYSPDLSSGKNDILAILFDMNRLYENYVYRRLKRLEDKNINIKISEQVIKKFWESKIIKPDILIQLKENSVEKNIIIDTKWKVLKELKPDDSDLKQMFVYNLHYNSDLSILLYPKVNFCTHNKKPFHLKNPTGSHYCQLSFIDLFLDDGDMKINIEEELFSTIISPINDVIISDTPKN